MFEHLNICFCVRVWCKRGACYSLLLVFFFFSNPETANERSYLKKLFLNFKNIEKSFKVFVNSLEKTILKSTLE